MPSESWHPYGQSPEQGLDRTKLIVLEQKRWIRLSHLHRLVPESPLLNCDNRALQVTYNPMGSPEIQSNIVEIHGARISSSSQTVIRSIGTQSSDRTNSSFQAIARLL
jgi:hypothetical protein